MLELAMSTPPNNVVAVVLFLVAGVLAAIQKDYKFTCLSLGLAALAWPW